MSSRKTIKSGIESMMFIWGEPLDVKDIADVFNIDKKEAYECCRELMEEYEQENRGIVIREVNKAFQFTTRPENLPYIERLCTPTRHRRLSQSALETLAIVAYRQPVTKGDIERIRGVSSDHAVNKLVEFGLVEEAGRLNAPGRPILFKTTEEFLRRFQISEAGDLPLLDPVQEEEIAAAVESEVAGQEQTEKLARAEAEVSESVQVEV